MPAPAQETMTPWPLGIARSWSMGGFQASNCSCDSPSSAMNTFLETLSL